MRAKPLSRNAAAARKPLPPAELLDALQDSVAIKQGRVRAARSAKVRLSKKDGK